MNHADCLAKERSLPNFLRNNYRMLRSAVKIAHESNRSGEITGQQRETFFELLRDTIPSPTNPETNLSHDG